MKSKRSEGKFFLDTNIFIYSFDKTSLSKKKIAQDLVEEALSSGNGVISHQVIQEFGSVALTRFEKRFDTSRLALYFDEVLFGIWKAYPDRDMYLQALQLKDTYQFSWWDSLIVAAALSVGCNTLYSEDMQHGQTIHTLMIVNPFLK